MKGKTGKPSAMRGGGIARKGVGMALKGGGIARKGTGSNATPGGKKMAMGGPTMGRKANPAMTSIREAPSDSRAGITGGVSRPIRTGLFGQPGMGDTPKTPGMVRPGFPSKPGVGKPTIPDRGPMPGTPQLGGDLPLPRPPQYQVGMPSPGYSFNGMKKGGKVSKYAKGGSVKMTAGAGSGSGRLEKVAAHKAAKRVPATGLKNGGVAKKMKGGGLGKILTQLSPAAMLIKGEMPKMGLLGMGLDAIKGRKDQEGSSGGRSPDQVKKELGLKKGGKVKRK